MSKFSKEEINKIIGLKSPDGVLIDIFNLHGVLFVGNCRPGKIFKPGVGIVETEVWDIEKSHVKMSEHSLPILIEDFEDCETEDDVHDKFSEMLEEAVKEKLV